MTVQLFISLFAVLCIVATALTEAVKKATKEKLANNLLAAIISIVVGVGGSCAAYIIMAIPFTIVNIVAIIGLTVAIWVGSMIGYDKVKQLIAQIFIKINPENSDK